MSTSALAAAPTDVPGELASPPLLADGLAVDHPRKPPLAPDAIARRPLIRLVAFVAIAAIVFLLFYFPAATLPATTLHRWAAPIQALSIVVPVVLAYWVVGRFLERRRPLAELAWSRVGGLGVGLVMGFVLMSVAVGAVWLLGGIRFHGTQYPADWATLLWIAGLQAGVAEELFFRGILYRYVEEGFGTWAALVVSAVVFGAAHLMNPGATVWGAVAIAVEAGVLFAVLFALTRSLWLVIGVHAAWNLTQGLLYGVPVSGGRVVGWLRSEPTGPEWLSGASFGLEASVVTTVMMAALSAWLLVVLVRRGLVVAPFWVRRRRLTSDVS